MVRKQREDFGNEYAYEMYLDKIIKDLVEALKPFAEKPSISHDRFHCHFDITTKEKCGRCSRAFAA